MEMSELFELVPREFYTDFENLLHEREVSDKFWERVKTDEKMQRAVIIAPSVLSDACAPC